MYVSFASLSLYLPLSLPLSLSLSPSLPLSLSLPPSLSLSLSLFRAHLTEDDLISVPSIEEIRDVRIQCIMCHIQVHVHVQVIKTTSKRFIRPPNSQAKDM